MGAYSKGAYSRGALEIFLIVGNIVVESSLPVN